MRLEQMLSDAEEESARADRDQEQEERDIEKLEVQLAHLRQDHEKEKEAQLVLAEQRLNKHKEEKDAEDLAWALRPPTPPNVGMRRTPYPRRMHGERGRAALRRSLA